MFKKSNLYLSVIIIIPFLCSHMLEWDGNEAEKARA